MNKIRHQQLILLAGDAALLFFSLYAILRLRYIGEYNEQIWDSHILLFTPIFLLWIIIFYIGGLYDLRIFSSKNKLVETFLKNLALAAGLSILWLYFLPSQGITPKTNLLLLTLAFAFLFLGWRYLFYSLSRHKLPKTNLGAIGYNHHLAELIKDVKANSYFGYELKFIVAEDAPKDIGLPIYPTGTDLKKLITKYKLSGLILENNLSNLPDWQSLLFECLPLGINYFTLPEFYENITGKVPLEIIDRNWFLSNLNLADKKFYEFTKRIMDITGAIIGLLISLVFWPFIFLAIKIEDHGPIFFRQARVGGGGKIFVMIKFRTMTVAENNYSFTEFGDKRITRVGKFLRRTRLDELPQLINIIKGEMSLIGPRPERPEFIKELEQEIPFYNIRSLVKPGLTGWDQISGEYHSPLPVDTFKKLQYDLFYIKNRSLYLDLTIILKTFKTVVSKEGR